jgi:DNA-binding transcriptional regulator YiaG
MPNIATMLKAEIIRLARKEVRAETAALRKASAAHRRQIAALKREMAALARHSKSIAKSARSTAKSDDAEATVKHRFSAKGFKTLRAKLGLSASDLGTLLGVSMQSVYNWERGKAIPRASQVAAIAGLRSVGKREAKQRLQAKQPRKRSA